MSGMSLDEAFPFRKDGQECDIYKAEWPEKPEKHLDAAIYIPDIGLNDIPADKKGMSEEEIDDILGYCYTVRDFVAEAYGNARLAKDLFATCDWQNPDVQDLKDCTDDEEAVRDYGETWQEMEDRAGNIDTVRKELYRLYQLDWMMYHNQSVDSVIRECQNIADEYISEDYGEDISLDLREEFNERGFDGSMYVCFDEFLGAEYLNEKYMSELMERSPLYAGGFLVKWYKSDTTPVYRKGDTDIISVLV